MSETAVPDAGGFSTREIRALVSDLMSHRPLFYWTDLLLSLLVAYGGLAAYLNLGFGSAAGTTAGLASALALYRIGTFTHEIVHMPRGSMRAFKLVWNLSYGLPWLMPSQMYDSHLDHHSAFRYGTPADAEYLPLGASPSRELLRYLLMLPLLPVLAVLRFLVLSPVAWLLPPARRWTLERASALAINPWYRMPPRNADWRRRWYLVEALAFAYLLGWTWLLATGTVAPVTLAKLYLLITTAIGINWVRTLAAHRYVGDGSPMSQVEQLRDSINLIGPPIVTELLFPVGLRYHALHHLLPTLPYHALPEAHERLMAALPPDSPYRDTVRGSFGGVLRDLWGSARTAGRRGTDASSVWRDAPAAEP